MSSNEEDLVVPIPRKRNVDNWQIIRAKRARNSGKEYYKIF